MLTKHQTRVLQGIQETLFKLHQTAKSADLIIAEDIKDLMQAIDGDLAGPVAFYDTPRVAITESGAA